MGNERGIFMQEGFKLGIDFAREMDDKDELKNYRERFYLREGELYYRKKASKVWIFKRDTIGS